MPQRLRSPARRQGLDDGTRTGQHIANVLCRGHASRATMCAGTSTSIGNVAGIALSKSYLSFAVSLTGRDPSVFGDPMAFSPEREQQPRHIAFGRGTHICLGQFLAVAQMEEGLHLIAQRIVRPRLNGEVTWRPFRSGAWGIQTLPIEFEPAAKPGVAGSD